MPRFAANLTMMFTELPFPARFAAAAEAGFEAVECLFPYEMAADHLAETLKMHHLTLALFNMPPGDWAAGERGIACLEGREAEVEASIDKALTYAHATGTKRLHMMAGLGEARDHGAMRLYKDALRRAASLAAPEGITILIEPLNRRDMPGYLLDDFSLARWVIEDLALPNLKLQYDVYHRQLMHGNVLGSLEALLPIIGHIQLASVPERHEPGTGELDDARIFERLDAMGYQEFIGAEYRPKAGTQAGLGWFTPYRKGRQA
jgi:2-dehydrotetronate isomerase